MLDRADDRGRTLDTLAAPFVADPIERWRWPDADEFAAHFAEFAECFAANARKAGTTWQVDDYSAVSVWMPPGVDPDAEQIGTLLRSTVAEEKHEEMFRVLAEMDDTHPRYPHWYLPWVGVAPGGQGLGAGGRLLDLGLEYVDRG